jgi:hypothetical protein
MLAVEAAANPARLVNVFATAERLRVMPARHRGSVETS